MAQQHCIGAKDRIDKLLVQKYSNLKVNNLDSLSSIPVDKFWTYMDMMAKYHMAIRTDIKKYEAAIDSDIKKSNGV